MSDRLSRGDVIEWLAYLKDIGVDDWTRPERTKPGRRPKRPRSDDDGVVIRLP